MKINVNSTESTFYKIIEKLKNNERCIYSRFGDGDIYTMMGKNDSNTRYSEELRYEMQEAFSIIHPDYLKGLAVDYDKEPGMYDGVFAPHKANQKMSDWLNSNFTEHNTHTYENAITYHYFSIFRQQEMVDFLDSYIRNKQVMFIGSIPKNTIEKLLGNIEIYVETPQKNAYYYMKEWYPKVEKNINKVDICIPAAGLATRVVNKNLWGLDADIHSLDIGSIVDAVDKRNTRTWIKREGGKIENILIK